MAASTCGSIRNSLPGKALERHGEEYKLVSVNIPDHVGVKLVVTSYRVVLDSQSSGVKLLTTPGRPTSNLFGKL